MLAIRFRVDQIIAGVVINIFALGITSFLSSQLLVPNADDLNRVDVLRPIKLPLLGDIPFFGPILFDKQHLRVCHVHFSWRS